MPTCAAKNKHKDRKIKKKVAHETPNVDYSIIGMCGAQLTKDSLTKVISLVAFFAFVIRSILLDSIS